MSSYRRKHCSLLCCGMKSPSTEGCCRPQTNSDKDFRRKMKRRLFLAGLVPAAALSNAAALFNPDHEGHGKERGRDHHEDEDSGGPRHEKASIRYFRPEDRVLLRRNYPVRSLPP